MKGNIDFIDWNNDDGVSLPMINDFVRNSFYDDIFVGTVKDKVCLEIGFGTGLLSILALKHGAKKIIAFESDDNRYSLGKMIIDRLNLSNSIELHHKRYGSDQLDAYPEVNVIFCEVVDSNLWGEGLYLGIPKDKNVEFIPGKYFFEVCAIEVPNILATRLMNLNKPNRFTPGIDIDQNFLNIINETISNRQKDISNVNNTLERGIVNFNQWNNQNYWEIFNKIKTTPIDPVVRYELDVNKKRFLVKEQYKTKDLLIDELGNGYQFTLNTDDWVDKIVLLIPRVGMKHGDSILYLDNANSWGPTADPVLLVKHTKNVSIYHNFLSGKLLII